MSGSAAPGYRDRPLALKEAGGPTKVRLGPNPTSGERLRRLGCSTLSLLLPSSLLRSPMVLPTDVRVLVRHHQFYIGIMADVVLPDGRTLSEWVAPQLARAYESAEMPALLPGPRTSS